MTTKELELAILDLICKIYCKKYITKLKVEELKYENEVIGYHLSLDLNRSEEPLTINKEGSAEDFLKCIEHELRIRHLSDDTYSLGYKVCN